MNYTTEKDILDSYELLLKQGLGDNRTGIKTANLFCQTFNFDLRGDHVPFLNTKTVNSAAVLAELEWFILGNTNNKVLNNLGTKIWNEWAGPQGQLGPIYGAMWRRRPVSIAAAGKITTSVQKLHQRYGFEIANSQEVELSQLRLINEVNKGIDKAKKDYPVLYKTWLSVLSFCASRYLTYLNGEDVFVNFKIEDKQERLEIAKELMQGVVGDIQVDMFGAISPCNICNDWLFFEDFVADFSSIANSESVDITKGDIRITPYLSGTRVYGPSTTCVVTPLVKFVMDEFLRTSSPQEQADTRPVLFIDQLQDLIDGIKSNPASRRLLVSSWEPSLAPDEKDTPSTNYKKGLQALTPCHHEFQVVMQPQSLQELVERLPYEQQRTEVQNCLANGVSLAEHFKLHDLGSDEAVLAHMLGQQLPRFMPYNLQLRFSMRSSDVFLGLPFNISSYGVLAHWLAMMTGSVATDLCYNGTSYHMYANTMDKAAIQVKREVLQGFPRVVIPFAEHISQFDSKTVELVGYNPQAPLAAPVAV